MNDDSNSGKFYKGITNCDDIPSCSQSAYPPPAMFHCIGCTPTGYGCVDGKCEKNKGYLPKDCNGSLCFFKGKSYSAICDNSKGCDTGTFRKIEISFDENLNLTLKNLNASSTGGTEPECKLNVDDYTYSNNQLSIKNQLDGQGRECLNNFTHNKQHSITLTYNSNLDTFTFKGVVYDCTVCKSITLTLQKT